LRFSLKGPGFAPSPRPVPSLRSGLRPPGWPLTLPLHCQTIFPTLEIPGASLLPRPERARGFGGRSRWAGAQSPGAAGVRR